MEREGDYKSGIVYTVCLTDIITRVGTFSINMLFNFLRHCLPFSGLLLKCLYKIYF